MTWRNDRAARQASDATYRDPAYLANRALAVTRANGRCEGCHRSGPLQCDHIVPVSQGGTHALDNLRMLCHQCHRIKTGREGRASQVTQSKDPEPASRTRW